jgi:acetylornithine deacetylase/succinyl-diaminopimelate desuccinylase-like protein
MTTEQLHTDAIELLQTLIATPSLSREEEGTASIIKSFFAARGIPVNRHKHNLWCVNQFYDATKQTVLLNSHHDTVKPNIGYTRNPHDAAIVDGKLFGLGSNDAGGCLVSLMACFLHFYPQQNLPFNLVLVASAEEEISGADGIESIISLLPKIDMAIVGEPTLLQMAIAEKGLLVLDCVATGIAGHAAREEGENAIYKAMKDIDWLRSFQFPKLSETLGAIKMSITSIATENKAHNVVPAQCSFVVDVRVTDAYRHEEVLEIIQQNISSEVKPRSLRLRSSSIAIEHPLVQAGLQLGLSTYGSPTLSDQALLPYPSIKLGPGDSARSHIADEFIFVQEIKDGIETYIHLLNNLT